MKRFLSLKRALHVISVTALAVLFLFFLNNLLSDRSIFQNLFSTKKVFVGTFDVGEDNKEISKSSSRAKEYSASLSANVITKKKVITKTSEKIASVVSSTKISESPTRINPKLYIQEIQAGNEVGALNEFVRICNYGDPVSLKDFSLKKKSSTGREEGLIADQWSSLKIEKENCIYVANSSAILSVSISAQWAKSHALAEKNNTLLLYYNNTLIDEVFWNIIPKGKSIIRESVTSTWHVKS